MNECIRGGKKNRSRLNGSMKGAAGSRKQLLYINVQWFRGGLVSKAHGPLHHSNLDLRVTKDSGRQGFHEILKGQLLRVIYQPDGVGDLGRWFSVSVPVHGLGSYVGSIISGIRYPYSYHDTALS